MDISKPMVVAEAEKYDGCPSTTAQSRKTWFKAKAEAAFYSKIILTVVLLFVLLQHARVLFAYWAVCTQAGCAITIKDVPPFVLEYAPLVWLDESEAYFPSDILAQVENTHPLINFSAIIDAPTPLTLENLDLLNMFGDNGKDVFLTSTIDVTTNPSWLEGVIPDSQDGKTHGASSCAIIVNYHGHGIVDAFYMYFYAYNQGNTVLFRELGDHIGDWEHNMIRFKDGKPEAMWFSQHGNGQAFTYNAVEKAGIRPISYSATGSHANYAIAGAHDHSLPNNNLPFGFLIDHTSKGSLWDPTLNAYFYGYDPESDSFASLGDGTSPLGAMNFRGKWGDEQYPGDDPRQGEPFFGFHKYVSGPTGPWDKNLNRTSVCPSDGRPCIIKEKKAP